MPTGNTTTGSLADSLDTIVASARVVREFEGVMPQLVDKVTLGEGNGTSWKEVTLAALTAQAITENTELKNYQQLSDTAMNITPTMIQIAVLITDKVKAVMNKKAWAKTGGLAQNAIQRKKDEDGLAVLDAATTSLCGAGTTLTSGHVSAAVDRIEGNAIEAGNPPFRCVLHGYQVRDIANELTAGVGTYPIGEGETARVFKEGFRGTINQASVYIDGNITIDSSDDAKGGVFAKEAIILVQGMAPKTETQRRPDIGGGADILYIRDEYAYGERQAGYWLYELYSDATAPTS
ncbi:MAG: hypothetical protein M0R06_21925 [Sphaerochaeta sp.]|nr:hypothetical protein [Sphaerochaeta sp.]